MDDIETMLRNARPEAGPYGDEARSAARARLLRASAERPGAEARRVPRRRIRFAVAVAGALAVAAGAVVVGRPDAPAPAVERGPGVVSLPVVAPVSATEVLGRAASAAKDSADADPRDDQFVQVESQTMYGSFGMPAEGGKEKETRYLYRTKRTIWQSADGSRDGALKIEYLPPRPYPGWPMPEQATKESEGTSWHLLPACQNSPETPHYAALKRLPADAEGMRDYLYDRADRQVKDAAGKDLSADDLAWTLVGDLLRETAMPAAQRAALFEAAKSIPGTTVTEDATDAADRTGIGVGHVGHGIRQDLIFHPRTYAYLGERGIVVDAAVAQAPEGSLVASTAELKVSVADEPPAVDDPRAGC